MFNDVDLINHIENSPTIDTKALISAELNFNIAENIADIGNYKNRPEDDGFTIKSTYAQETAETSSPEYYGFTDSDVIIDGGFSDEGVPQTFLSTQQNKKLIFSLEDCFNRFRPRSGINKATYFGGTDVAFIHDSNPNMMKRPRYYISSKNDKFKYWTSFRQESVTENIDISNIQFYPLTTTYSETTQLKITTNAPHNLVGGESVQISGSVAGSTYGDKFNGRFTVKSTGINSNTFLVDHFIPGEDLEDEDYQDAPILDHFHFDTTTTTDDLPTQNIQPIYVSGASVKDISTLTSRGISLTEKLVDDSSTTPDQYYIDDVAPFVVYNKKIPVNRVILKIQTHIGTEPIVAQDYEDPFYDVYNEDGSINRLNRRMPITWRIEYLDAVNGSWQTLKEFDHTDNVTDGEITPIIGEDGYIELHYDYTDGESSWVVGSPAPTQNTLFATDLVNPKQVSGLFYEQFQYMYGLRVVVDTMSKQNSTFDLIEISPRLATDLSDMTTEFSVSKVASDLGVSSMPVGQLVPSTGSITLADFDQVFNPNNVHSVENPDGSIIADYVNKNIQFKFYEAIINYDGNNNDIYIPIKSLYADELPETNISTRMVTVQLKDLYFHFDSLLAPQVLFKDISLSYAIAMLFDSIGFTNYEYKKTNNPEDIEPVIPFFFIPPNTTVAQVLNDIARSTQTAMFFNESNVFTMLSKYYMMPTSVEDREVAMTLYGTKDFKSSGTHSNIKDGTDPLANIIDIASKTNTVYNDGKINFTTRYIQKSYSSIKQANKIDNDKTWIYKPVLLWEVTGDETSKSINEEISNQSAYALTAVPLSTELSDEVPTVSGGIVINNVLDLGEAAYWMPRYNGYFYANGEIIKFDAIEYNTGKANVWISSRKEYQKYFAEIPFRGKLYPTGKIRIYSQPYYNSDGTLKTGAVAKHGRGQFGTEIVVHRVGVSNEWLGNKLGIANSNIVGNWQASRFLYNRKQFSETKYKIREIKGGGKKIRVYSTKTIRAGQLLSNYDGLTKNTKVSKVIDGKWFKTNKAVPASAVGKTITFSGVLIDEVYLLDTSKPISRSSETINNVAKGSHRTSLIKNFMSSTPVRESDLTSANLNQVPTGSVQSSALVFSGPTFTTNPTAVDFVSYIFKDYKEPFTHFGTRMRIVGQRSSSSGSEQSPSGASTYFSYTPADATDPLAVSASSGGIAVLVNPKSNEGYFFEISALNNIDIAADANGNVENIVFYKNAAVSDAKITKIIVSDDEKKITFKGKHSFSVDDVITVRGSGKGRLNGDFKVISQNMSGFVVKKRSGTNLNKSTDDRSGLTTCYAEYKKDGNNKTIPMVLWASTGKILVDDGFFTGQYRMTGEENPTVYDLAVEYEKTPEGTLKFYLYINNRLVGTVIDTQVDKNSLPLYKNFALFVRGSSKCMFEKVYALGPNLSTNYINPANAIMDSNQSFSDESENEPFKRYSIGRAVEKTYLEGLSPLHPPSYMMYYDEFGTIMREADYFNIRYDKAYPAFNSKIAPTLNKLKAYTVSGFTTNGYGAEFLIFNTSDTVVNLDSTSGNYLRILGITFTQESEEALTVDDYFKTKSDFSETDLVGSEIIQSDKDYTAIKNSRITYGRKEFTISAPYIQSKDSAEDLMAWLSKQIMRPRKSVGLTVFGVPHIQLGDIVYISCEQDGVNTVSSPTARHVVYNIEYKRDANGPTTTLYLGEVLDG